MITSEWLKILLFLMRHTMRLMNIDAVRSFAPGIIFTTALPPAIIAASEASIVYIISHNELREEFKLKTNKLRQAFGKYSIPVMECSTTHILPIFIGDAQKSKDAAAYLLKEKGIYVQPINFPSVPVGTERFRVNATPNHSDAQITELIAVL